MRDQPSSLFASSPHERIGGRAGKRKANQSDIMDDTLDGPKALKRSNKNSWRELEAYWSTQPVTSELQQGLIRRQVGWEEEEQLNSLKVIIAKAEEEAIAKMQAQVEELEMKLRDVLEKAKVTALEFKECYAGLMEDHDDLKNHVLLLYDEKKDLQAQLTTKQHVHDEEVADLEAKLEKYMTAYADDQETRCLALIRRAATFVPSGFEEIAQATFADCLERSKDKRKKEMPRPKAESWF